MGNCLKISRSRSLRGKRITLPRPYRPSSQPLQIDDDHREDDARNNNNITDKDKQHPLELLWKDNLCDEHLTYLRFNEDLYEGTKMSTWID